MLVWCFVFNIHKVCKMSSLTPTLLAELWGGQAPAPALWGRGGTGSGQLASASDCPLGVT